jgi:hypothetical protein
LLACKESSTPPSDKEPLVGEWVWSEDIGLVDTLDPADPYFPTYVFDSDNNFKETGYFVEFPSKRFIAYKYVKSGAYQAYLDSLTLQVYREVYVSMSDGLQSEPAPIAVSPYAVSLRYFVNEDQLWLIHVRNRGLSDTSYFSRKK